jgi:hypothetical protein
MNDADFALNKTSLAKELRGKDKKEELLKKIQKLNKKRYGGLGKTGKFLLSKRIIPILEEQSKRGTKKTSATLDNITPAERYVKDAD